MEKRGSMNAEITRDVREFYDSIGWQQVSEGLYQNARYEDLRPVSREYIHRCHMRVKRFLNQTGHLLLDAGSGPIQYPEYLTYSQDYQYRVCVDISIVALQEARKRIATHGLFIVADVASLPFKSGIFGGLTSLHTLHHLPLEDQKRAFMEMYRVLMRDCSAVVVNGWTESILMRRLQWLVVLLEKIGGRVSKKRIDRDEKLALKSASQIQSDSLPTGTFVRKFDGSWLHSEIPEEFNLRIYVWRSVSVRFLRAIIHPVLGGKILLKLLFKLEEKFPLYFGEKGQYPLIIFQKADVNE